MHKMTLYMPKGKDFSDQIWSVVILFIWWKRKSFLQYILFFSFKKTRAYIFFCFKGYNKLWYENWLKFNIELNDVKKTKKKHYDIYKKSLIRIYDFIFDFLKIKAECGEFMDGRVIFKKWKKNLLCLRVKNNGFYDYCYYD